MATANSGEKASSFAMACSLLSRYVRQNGAATGEISLGIRAETADAPARTLEARKKTMELFTQNVGFGTDNSAQDPAAAAAASEQEKRQLTIFYGGRVLVFDDFPTEKAKDLMQLACKGASPAWISDLMPPATAVAAATESTKVTAVPAPASASPVAQVNAQKPVGLSSADLPQARKASLHRFLEKRKDRFNAKTPYNSPSDAAPVKKELPESQPWLGLGPQVASPDLSMHRESSQ